MKHIKFLFVLFLLGALGCQRISEEDSHKGDFVIHAWTEGGEDTKTSLSGLGMDGMYHVLWASGDKITVYADGSTIPSDFSLTSGAGTDHAMFTGATAGSTFIGFYPSSMIAAEGWQNNVLTINLPQEQAYAAGTFAPETFPMIAVGSASNLTFKNLCAILKVSLTGEEQVNSIEFKPADASKIVSGKATIQTNYGGDTPQLVMTAGGANTVLLNCGAVPLNAITPTDFYLVIPAGTYSGGFSLDIKTFHGTVTKTTTQDITFERSQLRAVPAFECVGPGEDDPNNVPYNQIWYVTSDSRPIGVSSSSFDQEILSNVYENGKGVITFAGSITQVKNFAFFGSSVTEVFLPNCVESIGFYAFSQSHLTHFRTPDALSQLGEGTFSACNSLKHFEGLLAAEDGTALIMDNMIKAYAVGLLSDNGGRVEIPMGVTGIGGRAFQGPNALREVVIPEGVTYIGDDTFSVCLSLEYVTLPSTIVIDGNNPQELLQKMMYRAFADCPSLKKFLGDSPAIADDGNCLVGLDSYDLTNIMLYHFAGADIEDYVIPEGVTSIQNYAFSGKPSLRSLTFPNSLLIGPESAIEHCANLEFFYGKFVTEDHKALVVNNVLTTVTPKLPLNYKTPEGVEGIGRFVFYNHPTVHNLTVRDGVKWVDANAFNSNQLEELILSADLEFLYGENQIANCTSLKRVFFRSRIPPRCDSEFEVINGSTGIKYYVPAESYDSYVNDPLWSRYASLIQPYEYTDLPDSPDYYMSTDYSHDGEVATLQAASAGNGINLVLMGDAYSDRQIADGSYAAAMNRMMEAFFSEEPYATYRYMFNVYAVTVVSSTEGYDHAGQSLATYFGDGTLVGGNDDKVIEYAQKVVSSDQMNNTLIMVAMNRDYYAGTCYTFYPSFGDYGDGLSVAYFPTSSDESVFKGLVRHEAGGHGFAKLGDEYAYEEKGTVPQDEIDKANQNVPYGWWKNVDFTGDPATVKWAKFLSDSRYQNDGLGCFEGAYTYWTGAWRPTDNSIMRYNTDGFNAPSREAIWYRIHKLAYGDTWEYNYEDFVAYDAVNRKTSASASVRRNYVERRMEPTHAPVVVGRRWNDPAPKADTPALRKDFSVSVRPEGPVFTRDYR